MEKQLLNSLDLTVRAHEGVKDGQDVTTVVNHAGKDVAELRIVLGLAVPLGEDHAGDFDVAPQLVGRMAAKEKPIEKGRFALREVQILEDFDGNGLWHGGHEKNAVYRKAFPRQVGLMIFCRVGGNTPQDRFFPKQHGTRRQRRGCGAVLTAIGC